MDGSCFDCLRRSGYDRVLRSDNGSWLLQFSASVQHTDIVMVELWAMHRGLELAWEHGFRDIICETDCLEAFDLVQFPIFSRFHALDEVLLAI